MTLASRPHIPKPRNKWKSDENWLSPGQGQAVLSWAGWKSGNGLIEGSVSISQEQATKLCYWTWLPLTNTSGLFFQCKLGNIGNSLRSGGKLDKAATTTCA